MIGRNPFLSNGFKSIWLKHFNAKNHSIKTYDHISGLGFVKHHKLPVYVNIGETHTKGISYTINSTKDYSLDRKALLIYDVPTYFNIDASQLGNRIKLLKSKQYPGFLIEISKYKTLNDYMLANFSKNSRNKNKKYKRRLEASFNISYKMFLGEISKEEYDFIFTEFKHLLEKRFAEKQITNNNLDPKEWSFYSEVAYGLILEKKACLYVIYSNNKPIGVTLSYLSEDILFDAITVFDIDYSKFHLGSVTIMKLIEWCISNNMKVLDFSKGYFEYKTRWCTKTYDFEYHIYYDRKSLKSKIIALVVKSFYELKQKLREKNVNKKLHRLTYRLKKREQNITKKITHSFREVNASQVKDKLRTIDLELVENRILKLMVFEFLYLYEENYDSINFFQLKKNDNNYLIKGQKKSVLATLNM